MHTRAVDVTWTVQGRARTAGRSGRVALLIEHVGSTSVVGLAAKPIVDVQLSVTDPEDEDDSPPGPRPTRW